MLKKNLLAAVAALALSTPVFAQDWTIDPAKSAIAFSGTHAGAAFEGRFATWSGTISFDPASLAAAKALIDIDLASASTDDATRDASLPQPDFLDSATNPLARFESVGFKAGTTSGEYVMSGSLTLRGITVPIEAPFKLSIDGANARAEGTFTIKRLDFKIAQESDPTGQWVALDIPVSFVVAATKK